jgi:hypothetical protein
MSTKKLFRKIAPRFQDLTSTPAHAGALRTAP